MSQRIQGTSPKEYNGIHYRSTLEANTAKTLHLLGIPANYESKKITLLDSFSSKFQKNKVKAIHYTPDFIIGNIIIECKGFETPEWKIKKKYIFKYLMEKEPNISFYQTHNNGKDLLLALDNHWDSLNLQIQTTSKKSEIQIFSSIKEAFQKLSLTGKTIGPILKSLIGEREFVYNYKWKLIEKAKKN